MTEVVHYLDPKTMAYTACKLLPTWSPNRQWSAKCEDVTCPSCLLARDAEGQQVSPGDKILMPNGKPAKVIRVVACLLPEVVVIFRGEEANIPARAVVLL